jgi:DNA topoisomerase VI subunit B
MSAAAGMLAPRTVFAASRATEFLEARALAAQTGQPQDRFGDVVVKELIDNALDAAESQTVTPEITVNTTTAGDLLYVTVIDNGAGIPADVVEQILDFNALVSDKSAYRSPTRGLQGNAWKTVLGIAQLGTSEPVIIEARGVRHEVAVSTDPGGQVRVRHDRSRSTRTAGTAVTVPLPSTLRVDIGRWLQGFALANPHAALSWLANGPDSAPAVFYKSTVGEGWRKTLPSDRHRPHWYDGPALRRLIFAHIGRSRAGHDRDLPLGEFIRGFDGLSSTAKAKAVRAALPHIERLSDFETDPDVITALLAGMRAGARAPKPTVLGYVPESHYRDRLGGWFGVDRFWFNRRTVVIDGLPWVFEVAVAETTIPGTVFYQVNHSPAYGDPLGDVQLHADGEIAFGAGTWLRQPYPHADTCAAAVHVITPAPEFLDKGKVRLHVPVVAAEQAAAALAAATKTLRKEKKRRDRDARQEQQRQEQRRRRAAAEHKVTLKDATFAVMAEAVAHVSGNGQLPVPQRNLFYAVRDRVQRFGVEFNPKNGQDYFRALLTQYQQKHGAIPGLYYDPRGELREPHTGKIVRLGTRQIAEYQFPCDLYNKMLYVEKEGFGPLFEAVQLGERYDLGIVAGKGQPVEAVRALFERAEQGDYQLFVLHDADPYGYSIARTISEETARMPGYSVDVIDLGLTVADALERGLNAENFTRRKALPYWMPERLTEQELEWFEGHPCARMADGSSQWACRRVELNAFTAPQLIEFIEDGLAAHGATAKVVPPDDTLSDTVRAYVSATLKDAVQKALNDRVDVDVLARRIAADNNTLYQIGIDRAVVLDNLADNPPISWREVVTRIATDHLAPHHQVIEDRARAVLADALTEGGVSW